MKVRTLIAILAVFSVLLGCGGKGGDEAEGARFLRVSQILGKVEIKLVGGQFRPARAGMRLGERDEVKTGGTGSTCILQTPGGSVVRLGADSLLVMAKLYRNGKLKTEKTGLELLAGQVIVRAKKLLGGEEFSVRTKSATAGVRGTEFMVQVDALRNTRVAVRQGRVLVRRLLSITATVAGLKKALEDDTTIVLDPAQQVNILEKDNTKIVDVAEAVVKKNADVKDVVKLVPLVRAEALTKQVVAKPAPVVFTLMAEPELLKDFKEVDAIPGGQTHTQPDGKTTAPVVGQPARVPVATPGVKPAGKEDDEGALSGGKKQQEEQERKRLLEEKRLKMEADRKKALDDEEALRNRKTTDDRR